MQLDTRPWNLLAGIALATGCGNRLIGSEAGDDGTGGTNETDTPECVSDADCPSYYYCYQGMCMYGGYHDGHLDHYDDGWYYECYQDEDCGELSLCEFNYCNPIESLPACQLYAEPTTTLAIPAAALGLSFVDVDADGAEELVVAGSDELYVFESGDPGPVSTSPRAIPSLIIDAMVGGELDGMGGEDLTILAQDQLLQHMSDGMSGFGPALPLPSPFPGAINLRAGELDGMDPTVEILIRTAQSVGLLDGLPLIEGDILNATLRGIETGTPGFGVHHDIQFDFTPLTFFDPSGSEHGYVELRGGAPSTLVSMRTGIDTAYDVSSTRISSWTLFTVWDPLTLQYQAGWGLNGWVGAVEPIDLLGDGSDSLAMLVDGRVLLHRSPLAAASCSELDLTEVVTALAVGDQDGDGDDELAMRTASDNVLIYELD